MDDDGNNKYTLSSPSSLPMNNSDSMLYSTARTSPLSLTYYGYCLENGNYNVKLHFAEVQLIDEEAYNKVARRIFNIYVQVMNYVIKIMNACFFFFIFLFNRTLYLENFVSGETSARGF